MSLHSADENIITAQAKVVILRCNAFIDAASENHDDANFVSDCDDFLESINWLLAFDPASLGKSLHILNELRDKLVSLRTRKVKKVWPKVGKISEADNIEVNGAPVENDTASAVKITQLLQDQKDIYSREVVIEKETQEKHLLDLNYLTESLKKTTLTINQAVKTQTVQLDMIQQYALENSVELEIQKKKLAERTESAQKSICTGLISVLWIIIVFVATYVVIRLFSLPQIKQCPNR